MEIGDRAGWGADHFGDSFGCGGGETHHLMDDLSTFSCFSDNSSILVTICEKFLMRCLRRAFLHHLGLHDHAPSCFLSDLVPFFGCRVYNNTDPK